MRLFIAVNFDPDTKSKIAQVAKRLQDMGVLGNYSKEQNYHITLLFLGESDERQLFLAKNAIREIKLEPFDITIQNLSNFAKNIVHLKVQPNENLNYIHNYLYERLKNYFTLDNSAFSPHITLIRKPNKISFEKNGEFRDILPFSYRTDNVSLMLSSRQNGELVYTPLFEHKLG